MRISSTPWEVIWLLDLFVFMVSIVWTVAIQLRARKLSVPKSFILYGSLLLLIVIPAGLRAMNYRFKLEDGNSELTQTSHEIPELVIREYTQYSLREVYEASLRALQSANSYGLPWIITFAELEEHRVARLEADVPVLIFVDHLTITIQLIPGQPGLRVILLSSSESAKRDYGENARHIKQFYDALEAELAKNR